MHVFRDNGLTMALMLAFAFSIGGMGLAGWSAHNQDLAEHGQPAVGLLAYIGSGDFVSALFENWESEFLQMSTYVMLTAYLFQRGSAESRDPDGESRDEEMESLVGWNSIAAFLYSYSLGIALAVLFILSFVLHLAGSVEAANEEALRHGGATVAAAAHLADARFWFESFQNWQSEFLSTAVLVVFSIFLRYRASPESKPVGAPNAATGK